MTYIFFEKLESLVRENEDKNIVIGGDFNTVLDPNRDKTSMFDNPYTP